MNYLNVKGVSAVQLWELDEHNKPKGPKDEENLFNAINFFDKNPQWVNKHQDKAKKYCKLLVNTDITKIKLSKEASEIQATLIKKHPNFFHLISFNIGGVERKILKSLLVKRSDKFRTMLEHNMKEKVEKEITLEAEGVDRKVFNNFVDYLTTGEIELDGKNVMPLLGLAQEHLISHLTCACLNFIEENLKNDTFIDLLKYALESNNDDLKWQCFIYVSENKYDKDLLALLRNFQEINWTFFLFFALQK